LGLPGLDLLHYPAPTTLPLPPALPTTTPCTHGSSDHYTRTHPTPCTPHLRLTTHLGSLHLPPAHLLLHYHLTLSAPPWVLSWDLPLGPCLHHHLCTRLPPAPLLHHLPGSPHRQFPILPDIRWAPGMPRAPDSLHQVPLHTAPVSPATCSWVPHCALHHLLHTLLHCTLHCLHLHPACCISLCPLCHPLLGSALPHLPVFHTATPPPPHLGGAPPYTDYYHHTAPPTPALHTTTTCYSHLHCTPFLFSLPVSGWVPPACTIFYWEVTTAPCLHTPAPPLPAPGFCTTFCTFIPLPQGLPLPATYASPQVFTWVSHTPAHTLPGLTPGRCPTTAPPGQFSGLGFPSRDFTTCYTAPSPTTTTTPPLLLLATAPPHLLRFWDFTTPHCTCTASCHCPTGFTAHTHTVGPHHTAPLHTTLSHPGFIQALSYLTPGSSLHCSLPTGFSTPPHLTAHFSGHCSIPTTFLGFLLPPQCIDGR